MEQQIFEIANFITEGARSAVEDADALYNAGYRKASDVAMEIFKEIESCKWSETQYGDHMLCFEINSEKYAELKKKYEVTAR